MMAFLYQRSSIDIACVARDACNSSLIERISNLRRSCASKCEAIMDPQRPLMFSTFRQVVSADRKRLKSDEIVSIALRPATLFRPTNQSRVAAWSHDGIVSSAF